MLLFAIPDFKADCLVGAWPIFAERTLPINNSWTFEQLIPDFERVDLIAIEPKSVAVNDANDPR